jgi:hypothetical protein
VLHQEVDGHFEKYNIRHLGKVWTVFFPTVLFLVLAAGWNVPYAIKNVSV